jgi:hypothetical protein
MLLDDHDLVAMTMPPSAMVATVMPVVGARAMVAVMMTMIATATLDHDGLRARNRRRSDNDRTKRSQHKSKLLHSSPPQLSRMFNCGSQRSFPRNLKRILNVR